MPVKVPWMWEEGGEIKSLDDLPKGAYGFIYAIVYEDDSFYIGKKDLGASKRLPALKSGEQRPNSKRIGKNVKGKRVYFDIVTKESDWLTYEGSSEFTKGLVIKDRFILEVAYSKRQLTYMEVKKLFNENVLEDEACHNKCILNMFYKGNLI